MMVRPILCFMQTTTCLRLENKILRLFVNKKDCITLPHERDLFKVSGVGGVMLWLPAGVSCFLKIPKFENLAQDR